MTEKHYLLKVFGLGTAPRFVTFLFTLVSFPLLVRGLGAAEYGVFVYVSSVVNLFDPIIDFGISSATGKVMAAARIQRPETLRYELFQWIKAQAIVATVGFAVAVLAGYFYFSFAARADNGNLSLYTVLTIMAWISVGNALSKATLTSLVAFKEVAVLETSETILRDLGWIVVGLLIPTATALAAVTLVGLVIQFFLGGFLLRRRLKEYRTPESNAAVHLPGGRKEMLRETLQFLGLRFATRAFQSFPLILIGNTVGSELVGLIGAFGRITEMISLPFSLFSRGLMVKAYEIRANGYAAINIFWRVLVRLSVIAFVTAGGLFLASDDIARIMVPESANAPLLFSIMSVLVLAQSISNLYAPASDYVGGLARRVVFLSACAILQLPLIWGVARVWGEIGAVGGLVGCYSVMIGGYVLIAKKAFFGTQRFHPPKDVPIALAVTIGALAASLLIGGYLGMTGSGELTRSVMALVLYAAILLVAFIAVPALKPVYPTLKFLDLGQ